MEKSLEPDIGINHLLSGIPEDSSQWNDYRTGLERYWQGHLDQALRLVADTLLTDPFHPFAMPLYRLWVEILSDQHEYGALAALERHLLVLSIHSDQRLPMRALRGMIHLVLDNWQACELIYMSLKGMGSCNYCLEFMQYFHNRISAAHSVVPVRLFNTRTGLRDYFHWDGVVQDFLWQQNYPSAEGVARSMKKIFPKAPLLEYMKAQRYIEQRNFNQALPCLKHLTDRFPDNNEFQFTRSFVMAALGDYAAAFSLCRDLKEEEKYGFDPDLHTLRAYCSGRLCEKESEVENQRKKAEMLQKASYACLSMNQSLSFLGHLSSSRLVAKSSERSDNPCQKRVRHWIHPVGPALSWAFKTASKDEIKTIFRSIGNKASYPDLIFFVHEVFGKSDVWNLLAVYQVAGQAAYHPFNRWESGLNLIFRFPVSILVDVIIDQKKDRRKSSRSDDMKAYHMLEIDEEAFDALRTVIREESALFDTNEDLEFLYAKIG